MTFERTVICIITVSGGFPRGYVCDPNVRGVVEGEADAKDEDDGRDDLDREAKVVGVAGDVYHSDEDREEDKERDAHVGHEDERHDDDAGKRQAQVAHQFAKNKLEENVKVRLDMVKRKKLTG
jgi:hypothetical protein